MLKIEFKRDSVENNKITNFIDLKHGQFWCSQNASNQPKSTVELGYMFPRVPMVHQQLQKPTRWNTKKRLLFT